MKKLSLVAAIATAASISSGAHAITSTITNKQLFLLGNIDIVAVPATPCPAPGLAIGGALNPVTLTGNLCLEPSGPTTPPLILLNFGLSGNANASGTTFNNGSVDIYTDWGTGSGFVYYSSVNAATTPIPCLVQLVGHLGTGPGTPAPEALNTTFGLHPKTGIWPLPGLWHPNDPNNPNDGINDAVCVMELFGFRAGLFLEGTMTHP